VEKYASDEYLNENNYSKTILESLNNLHVEPNPANELPLNDLQMESLI
jgi:hypothetical protein